MQTRTQSCKPLVVFNNVRRFKSISLCGDFAETGEGKAKLPKQKQRANALFNIKRADKEKKRKKKNTVKPGDDITKHTGESKGTHPESKSHQSKNA